MSPTNIAQRNFTKKFVYWDDVWCRARKINVNDERKSQKELKCFRLFRLDTSTITLFLICECDEFFFSVVSCQIFPFAGLAKCYHEQTTYMGLYPFVFMIFRSSLLKVLALIILNGFSATNRLDQINEYACRSGISHLNAIVSGLVLKKKKQIDFKTSYQRLYICIINMHV